MSIVKLILFFIILSTSFKGDAQLSQVEVEKNIENYRDSVYYNLVNGNAKKVDVRLGYLSYEEINGYGGNVGSQFYLALDEIESIYLLQHRFEEVLYILETYEFELSHSRRRVVVSSNKPSEKWNDEKDIVLYKGVRREKYFGYQRVSDSLDTYQGDLLEKYKDQILVAINATDYDAEVKDLLSVFLSYKIAYHLVDLSFLTSGNKRERESLYVNYGELSLEAKEGANRFIETYPQSKFNEFLSNVLLWDCELKKIAFGFEFMVGSMIPEKEMTDYLSPSFHALVGSKIYYQKLFLNLDVGIGVNIGRKDFFYDTLWSGTSSLTGSVEMGYVFDVGKNISLSPVVGVRNIWNFGADGRMFNSVSPFSYGVELSWGGLSKGKDGIISPLVYIGDGRENYTLKIMYQDPKYQTIIPELKGGFWMVTLGISFAYFKPKPCWVN